MPTGVCQTCGSTVRFEGIAGICPKCAAVVRAAAKPRSAPAAPAQASNAPKKRTKRDPVDLLDLDMGGDERFDPAASPAHAGGTDPVIFYLSIGAGAVILVFGLFYLLSALLSRHSQVATAPPPSPAPAPIVAPVDSTPTPDAVAPPPPTTVPVVTLVRPAVVATGPAWMNLTAAKPALSPRPITDDSVGVAIKKAVAFLKSQFTGDQLTNSPADEHYNGKDTLVVYALLHAGEAIEDSDLGISSDFIQRLLSRIKRFPMTGNDATYSRALRASALAMYARDVDAGTLTSDRDWLLKSEVGGAYTYSMPPAGTTVDNMPYDHSNSQYGVLGIWAASQAGLAVPDKYWNEVEQHWLKTQNPDGGWGYTTGDSSITMTSAGVTTLSVTAEQLELIASKGRHDAHPEMSAALARAVDWMGKEDRLLDFSYDYRGYSLYGVERAALATGLRWFGNHDWYRELGAREIKNQLPDGSWGGNEMTAPMDAAFRVLFLSRGRQPVLMNKLRFDGNWNNRPRDVAKLVQYASAQLEQPFAWGVADLTRNWWDWMESPLLFITTDTAPEFSDDQCKKLRAYTDAGGLIFIHNEYASQDVDEFVKSLVKRAYPEYALAPVAADDPIYSTLFSIPAKVPLKSVSNGTRTMLVYSPTDITQDWVRYRAKDRRMSVARELALNLFVSTAGKGGFRNRLDSPYEEPPDFDPVGTVPILQLSYAGPWNPEPKAFERFGRWFQKQTSIKLDVQPTKITDLMPGEAPVAVLTGNARANFGQTNFHALHEFVAKGGVLVIDPTGGSKAFLASVQKYLLPGAFPNALPTDLPITHPILAGTGACMDPLPKPRLRSFASLQISGIPPGVQYAQFGKGAIILCPLDITTGLLDSGTYGIMGYTPGYSQSLMKNIILWALGRYHVQS
jgi:hypothetical protein